MAVATRTNDSYQDITRRELRGRSPSPDYKRGKRGRDRSGERSYPTRQVLSGGRRGGHIFMSLLLGLTRRASEVLDHRGAAIMTRLQIFMT